MRYDIHLKASSIEDSVDFYVNKLGLFDYCYDYGMGNVLLKNINNSSFCLLLKKEEGFVNINTTPLFSIGVADASVLFDQFQKLSFKNGSGVVSSGGPETPLLEYALGKCFMMKDPDQNLFLISQWHETAL